MNKIFYIIFVVRLVVILEIIQMYSVFNLPNAIMLPVVDIQSIHIGFDLCLACSS